MSYFFFCLKNIVVISQSIPNRAFLSAWGDGCQPASHCSPPPPMRFIRYNGGENWCNLDKSTSIGYVSKKALASSHHISKSQEHQMFCCINLRLLKSQIHLLGGVKLNVDEPGNCSFYELNKKLLPLPGGWKSRLAAWVNVPWGRGLPGWAG